MNRILLLGKNGQLGWELWRTLAPLGQMIAVDRQDLDVTNQGQLREAIATTSPTIIVNASAFTDVDGAESKPQFARAVNRDAPALLADESRQRNIILVHYSTDFVFDGLEKRAYVEDDFTNPLNVYGKSKLEGEQEVLGSGAIAFIFRTSWVYSLRGNGFVSKVLRWAREQETLRVVDDQIGSPTWARMLAELTALALHQALIRGPDWLAEHRGIYHLAGSGAATRFEWAQAILELDPRASEQRCKALLPAKTDEFPTPARRPAYSALDCRKFEQTFGLRIPPWHESLELAMSGD
ncbi:MAG: dTDP-4-dehydrorhamnose reductase [Anaerolineae bacterium]|nr:MAG: dTDP-4-dehydrorhamnose reductase [Anaerolineae bacterium]